MICVSVVVMRLIDGHRRVTGHIGPVSSYLHEVQVRADVGSLGRAVKGLESRAVSVRVTMHFITILVKHVMIHHNHSP